MRYTRFIAVLAVLGSLLVVSSASADLRGKVRKLSGKVNSLSGQVDSLQAELGQARGQLGCLRSLPVTQYFGYDYNFDDFLTTALDITEAGDPNVSFYVVRDACGAIPVGRAVAEPMRRPAP